QDARRGEAPRARRAVLQAPGLVRQVAESKVELSTFDSSTQSIAFVPVARAPRLASEDHLRCFSPRRPRLQAIQPSAHARVRREIEPALDDQEQVGCVSDVGETEVVLQPVAVHQRRLEDGQVPRQLFASRFHRLRIRRVLPERLNPRMRSAEYWNACRGDMGRLKKEPALYGGSPLDR